MRFNLRVVGRSGDNTHTEAPMGKTGYDIRLQLVSDARDHLLHNYHQRRDIEQRKAELESRAPAEVPLPTAAEITALAEQLYAFVEAK